MDRVLAHAAVLGLSKHMSSHNYDRALSAFRPSVYSTGVQQLQNYSPVWGQGTDYGSDYGMEWSLRYFLDPVYFLTGQKVENLAANAVTSAAEAVKSSYVTYAQIQADIAEAERKRKEEAERNRRAAALNAVCVIALGAGSFLVYKQYKKTGRLPWTKKVVPNV